ncbi:putative receptor like protein 25 [Neltuma alba]|uniref:putative receptor like protein 25 n=1 Tax=Neltuma alba TaxID=207710 RepID=UPI0010A2B6D0|nr:putative receptor like protein 25 [Prosopis alba]
MAQYLVVIKLRANQFVGNIPLQLCNLPHLTILDLAENKLSGSIPHGLFNITPPDSVEVLPNEILKIFMKGREFDYRSFSRLLYSTGGVIDFSANSLSGEIPEELISNGQIQSLNLSRNYLTGKIPKEIGGMKVESLDLSYNKLSGEIPLTISNLSFLGYLNLSYNNFVGQIPLGTQIQTFDSWSFVGNSELCGDPLPNKCSKEEETHDSKLAEGDEDDGFLKSLYRGMGVGFAAGFWGACGSLFLIRAWRYKFFRWYDHLADQLYVAWALFFKSFS